MSYKAFYRKYRPRNFDEVVGQDHIISTLKNIVENDKIGHAYIFSGPRGTGKTSVAYILAKAVNKMPMASEINSQLDIIEIDAASNNGVAEIRSLIDNSKYAPSESKYKVYIIDEVHMLTKGAFNALLKTLEEPPEHVIFILATTEIHKIPITILSRSQRFNFRRIDNKLIEKQLQRIFKEENVSCDNDSLGFISRLSNGCLRDALSIADQAAAYSNNEITFEAISQVFGLISIQNQIQLINDAYSNNPAQLMKNINTFINNGVDIERLSVSLLTIVKDFIVYKKTGLISLLEILTKEELDGLRISISHAYEYIDILNKLISDLRFTEIANQTFELALLKMINDEKTHLISQEEHKNEQLLNVNKELTQEKLSTPSDSDELIENFAFNATEPEVQGSFSQEPDIFVTQVFNANPSDLKEIQLTAEELELKDQIENTDEFRLTPSEFIDEVEVRTQELAIDEEILSAQDIETSELDILAMFKSDDNIDDFELDSTSNISVPLSEFLNLMVLSSRNALDFYKEKWNALLGFLGDINYGEFVVYLKETKPVFGSDNFLVVASQQESVIHSLRRIYKTDKFVEFVNKWLGKPIYIFSISKPEFDEVKYVFISASKDNSLPIPRPIEAPKLKEAPKSSAEQFGTDIFGELLESGE